MGNVITFAEAAQRRKPIARAMPSVEQEPELSYRDQQRAKREERLAEATTNPNLTITCRNQRMRLSRRDAWWAARELTDYWRARSDWHSALRHAQINDIADANSFPKCDDSHYALAELRRAALVAQMLTPAPDTAAVAWKRTQLRRCTEYDFTDPANERKAVQRAIDADVKWLAAHPTKKSIAAARSGPEDRFEKRREWKAAFRARVTLYAEQNGIPKSELAWLGRLKHQDLVAFADRHRLSYDWLLEGRTMVREILQERDQ